MEIAEKQFWYDYIQNHKRMLNHKKIRKEIRKEKNVPTKTWQKIPEAVATILKEFKKNL